MDSIINSVISAIERLLTVVNSTRKLLLLACLTLLLMLSFLVYQLAKSQELVSELVFPKIERVGGWCYQQRVRRDSRIVAIQFPVPENLLKLGVEQHVSALVVKKNLTSAEFNLLCVGLVEEILDPNVEFNLLQSNPKWKQKLQDFYKNLNNPSEIVPLKNLEIKK